MRPALQSTSRYDWAFPYPIKIVGDGARRRQNYHAGREVFWRDEFEKMKADLPASITIQNMEALVKSSSVSNYGSPQLAIDPDVVRRFQRCSQKAIEHRDKGAEYARWVAVLDATEGLELKLTIADIEYFSVHDATLDRERAAEEAQQ